MSSGVVVVLVLCHNASCRCHVVVVDVVLCQIIPYIASQFRKDKIWLRRTKPSKRQYHVVVAIDNSRSMRDTAARSMACEAMATICKAMAKLEVCSLSRRGTYVAPANGARLVSCRLAISL